MFGRTMPCFPCSANGLYMLYFLRCFPKEMAVTKIIDSLENLGVVQGFLEVVKPYTGSVPFVLQTFFRFSSKKFGTYCLPAEVVPVRTKLPFCHEIFTVHHSLSVWNEKYCIDQSGSRRKLASGFRLSTAWHSRCIAQKKMSSGSTSRLCVGACVCVPTCVCEILLLHSGAKKIHRPMFIYQTEQLLIKKPVVSLVQIKDTCT